MDQDGFPFSSRDPALLLRSHSSRHGDLTLVIEQFVVAQFPASKSHFWVVNDTHWQTDNEVVVDLNTVVLTRNATANRYLLLIVGNKLAASQNIPLDTAVDCQPEQA